MVTFPFVGTPGEYGLGLVMWGKWGLAVVSMQVKAAQSVGWALVVLLAALVFYCA